MAGDGAEGVRLAREMHPDLIFMDVVMPGINGYQATRTLADDPDTSGIPIVMVTSKEPTDGPDLGTAPGRRGLHGEAGFQPQSWSKRRRPPWRPEDDSGLDSQWNR